MTNSESATLSPYPAKIGVPPSYSPPNIGGVRGGIDFQFFVPHLTSPTLGEEGEMIHRYTNLS